MVNYIKVVNIKMYRTSKEILLILGKKILEYYLSVTEEGQEIYLFIDDFLFESLIEDSNLSRDEVIRSLNDIQCRTTDSYVALAIVSFHVKILYDLNDVSEDSYYSQLQISYDSLRYLDHSQILTQFFYGCNFNPVLGDADGEIIWDLTKALFADNNRTLKVCDFHHNKGRFVDLPNSQKIITGSIRRILLDHIKDFNRLGLKPNQGGVSFDFIKRNIPVKYFPSDPVKKDMLYRLIFNFYNIWNGETKEDYINHRGYSVSRKIKEEELEDDEAVIVYTPGNDEFEFYLNRHKIENSQIPNRFISKLKNQNCIFVRNGKASNYWLLYNNTFSLRTIEEILVIYRKQDILSSFLPNLLINDNVNDFLTIKTFEDYKIYIFKYPISEHENQIFFNIYLNTSKQIKDFEITSGIKVKPYRNVWYSFALPIIFVYDLRQTEVYIDGEKQMLKYDENFCKEKKYLQITMEMLNKMFDRHKVKLKESSEFTFYIDAFSEVPDICFTQTGWNLNREKALYEISQDNFTIDGYKINEKMCYKKQSQRREFLTVLDKSLNNHIINNRIENWRKYGKE